MHLKRKKSKERHWRLFCLLPPGFSRSLIYLPACLRWTAELSQQFVSDWWQQTIWHLVFQLGSKMEMLGCRSSFFRTDFKRVELLFVKKHLRSRQTQAWQLCCFQVVLDWRYVLQTDGMSNTGWTQLSCLVKSGRCQGGRDEQPFHRADNIYCTTTRELSIYPFKLMFKSRNDDTWLCRLYPLIIQLRIRYHQTRKRWYQNFTPL